MKGLIARYVERIEAATLRERIMIFAAAALLLAFSGNAALLEPLRTRQKQVAAEEAKRAQERAAISAELQKLAGTTRVDPDAANRQRRAELEQEVAKLNQRLAHEQRRFTPPDQVRSVLQEVLQQNRRLTLQELRTLPVTSLAPSPNGTGVYRHGMEVTVTGNYLDLYEYLRSLEDSPTQLYWGRAELVVTEYPISRLKLTVYTVSLDRTWLIV